MITQAGFAYLPAFVPIIGNTFPHSIPRTTLSTPHRLSDDGSTSKEILLPVGRLPAWQRAPKTSRTPKELIRARQRCGRWPKRRALRATHYFSPQARRTNSGTRRFATCGSLGPSSSHTTPCTCSCVTSCPVYESCFQASMSSSRSSMKAVLALEQASTIPKRIVAKKYFRLRLANGQIAGTASTSDDAGDYRRDHLI